MTQRFLLPILLLVFVLAGCQSGNNNSPGLPDSEIQIRTDSGITVSTANNKGSINMGVGQKRQYTIFRIVRTGAGADVTTDVTNDVDFNFSVPGGAQMDSSGQLTAIAVGLTTLEVVFREDSIPSNDDKVSLDITVSSL